MKNKLIALLTNPHFHHDIQVMKKLDAIDCAYITISGRFDEEVWQRHVYCSVDQVIGKMIEEGFNPNDIISITINGL